ncbi:enoyl-CoA hydratase-related protein [Streptomyces sp. NPDC057575]|uniref:enoyl-CoA hydratase-related protein n=1 Tax=unclassified Streptomyces TaxID=2593676 RepID=UPI003682CEA2
MTIHTAQDDHVVTITIDRERKLNAVDYPTIDAMLAELDRVDCDDRVRAVVLTGDPIPATRAAEMGLVNTVVLADELLDAARDLAARIIRHAPTAVAACLRAVTRGVNLPIDEGIAVEAACFAATVPTDGVRTGLRRFLDRSATGPRTDGRRQRARHP